jgi:glycosyltransferase involved in cell wall biosynthesis
MVPIIRALTPISRVSNREQPELRLTDEGPLFSVIVIGYRRPRLIRDAIKSIAAQTIRREAFELVVVTDFEDEWIDQKCRELSGVHTVIDCGVGNSLAIAIKRSRGRILCFLDDDDMFHPEKLQVLEREMLSSPKIGYYHNFWRSFSTSSQVKGCAGPIDTVLVHRYTTERSLQGFARVIEGHATRWVSGFNLSCVSVRRSVVTPHLETISEVRAATDGLFLSLGLLSPLDSVFSDAPLTFYRIHASFSRPGTWSRHAYQKEIRSHSYLYLDSLERIRRLAVGSPLEAAIVSQQVWWRIRAALFGSRERLPGMVLLLILRSPSSAKQRLLTATMFIIHELRLSIVYSWISYMRASRKFGGSSPASKRGSSG